MDRDIQSEIDLKKRQSEIDQKKRAFFIYERHFDLCCLCLVYLCSMWLLIAYEISKSYDMPDVIFKRLALIYIPFHLIVLLGYPYIRTKIDLQKKEDNGGYDA